jgi:hypothetical protein
VCVLCVLCCAVLCDVCVEGVCVCLRGRGWEGCRVCAVCVLCCVLCSVCVNVCSVNCVPRFCIVGCIGVAQVSHAVA